MKLHDGQQAPDFMVEDVQGNTIRLKDYRGRRVLLCFFRYAGCPFCQLIVHKLSKRYARLQAAGIDVVAFFQSPRQSVITYMTKLNAPFPLVADPGESIYHLYGIESSLISVARGAIHIKRVYQTFISGGFRQGKIDGDFFLMPGYFLVGPNQELQHILYSTSFSDHRILEKLDGYIAEHQAAHG